MFVVSDFQIGTSIKYNMCVTINVYSIAGMRNEYNTTKRGHILNVKRSPPDSRDYLYKLTNNKLVSSELQTTSIDYRSRLYPCGDQGNYSSCGGWVAATCLDNVVTTDESCSPRYLYEIREEFATEDDPYGDGMTMRCLCKITKHGSVSNMICPYSEIYEPFNKGDYPDPHINASTYVNIFDAEKDILKTVDEVARTIISALNEYGCLAAGFPVFDTDDVCLWRNTNNAEFIGGHAMCIVGYHHSVDATESYFVFRNSWGTDWGDNGYCRLPVSECNQLWEIWGFTFDSKYNFVQSLNKDNGIITPIIKHDHVEHTDTHTDTHTDEPDCDTLITGCMVITTDVMTIITNSMKLTTDVVVYFSDIYAFFF